MSVRDYREEQEKFNECKEIVVNRAFGRCQVCGKPTSSLKVFFATSNAKKNCDPVQAVCLCYTHYETALSIYNSLEMQKDQYIKATR